MNPRIALWTLSSRGLTLAESIEKSIPLSRIFLYKSSSSVENIKHIETPVDTFQKLAEAVARKFRSFDGHIFIMATGIVVRSIAELTEHKSTDPAVVTLDDHGIHAISLLSGHLGGGNELAKRVASAVGATPVISTATDLEGILAFDELARIIGAKISNLETIKLTSSSLLSGEKTGFLGPRNIYERYYNWCHHVTLLEEFPEAVTDYTCFCLLTDKRIDIPEEIRHITLVIHPPTLSTGIGCHIGTGKNEILDGIKDVLTREKLAMESVFVLASVDAKKNEEGLLHAASSLGVPIRFYSPEEIKKDGIMMSEPSIPVQKHVGVAGVCEPSAYLAAGHGAKIIVSKQKLKNMTVAVARRKIQLPDEKGRRKLSLVGIGPGDPSQMTVASKRALCNADVVVGYKTYIDLIRPFLAGKKIITTGMKKEVERCKKAIGEVRKGQSVAVISSGDSGIYGMAGLVYELLGEKNDAFPVEVLPGVTSATAAAALVGAPLMCDYISLSLSDLLQSTDEVERRIRIAAASDLVTVLYNPKSRKRVRLIEVTREEFLKHRPPETPVAIVTDAYRQGERFIFSTLRNFTGEEIGMTSVVIIGNSQTRIIGNRMITVRGYRFK